MSGCSLTVAAAVVVLGRDARGDASADGCRHDVSRKRSIGGSGGGWGGTGVLDRRDIRDLMHGRSRVTIEGVLICCLP